MARNILQPAWKTTVKVGGTEVDGSELEYSYFHTTTGAQQAGAANGFPRIWKFYDYEKTWDAAGLMGHRKDPKGHHQRLRGRPPGKPRTFTMAGWLPSRYEWNSSGLITKNTYNPDDATPYKRFETVYTYHICTRLVSKITNVDGQFAEFTYDALSAPQQHQGPKVGATYNVQNDYTYQYKNATTPRSYVKSRTSYTATAGSSLTEKTIWQYFDGLGRPVQAVDQKHSPAQKDVAVTTEYDNQGRTWESMCHSRAP